MKMNMRELGFTPSLLGIRRNCRKGRNFVESGMTASETETWKSAVLGMAYVAACSNFV
jgi:hypothetical protein